MQPSVHIIRLEEVETYMQKFQDNESWTVDCFISTPTSFRERENGESLLFQSKYQAHAKTYHELYFRYSQSHMK